MISGERIYEIIKDYHEHYWKRAAIAQQLGEDFELNNLVQKMMTLENIMTDIEMENKEEEES